MAFFQECAWEGNVRELENLIVQSILFSPSDTVRPEDVRQKRTLREPGSRAENGADTDLPYKTAKEKLLKEFNQSYIGALLTRTGGNVTRAAKLCGMERQALQQVMRRYGISAEDFRSHK